MREIFPLRHLRTAAGFLLTILLCLPVVAPSASFAAPAQGRQAQDRPERRTIPVSVVDKDGNFVEGLTAGNFRGKFRGKPVKVLAVKDDTEPRHIAIAVDLSISLKERGLDSAFWSIAEGLIVNFTPRNNVSLYSFAGSVFVEAPFTKNRKKLQEVIHKLVDDQTKLGSRTTSLWDAIYLISRTFPEDDFAGVLYLISDAGETSSMVTRRNAEDALLRSGARVFVLCFPPPQRLVDVSDCSHFPNLSGGLVIPMSTRRIKTVGELFVYAAMYHRSIDQVYRLEVELSQEIDKRRKWKLEVVDERGKKMKGVKVLYPRLLVPLEEPPEEEK